MLSIITPPRSTLASAHQSYHPFYSVYSERFQATPHDWNPTEIEIHPSKRETLVDNIQIVAASFTSFYTLIKDNTSKACM